MDKIFSARVDEAILHRINMLAESLHMSKKAVIEGAILAFSEKMEKDHDIDILKQTFGAWKREESVEETIHDARRKFRSSIMRHQR